MIRRFTFGCTAVVASGAGTGHHTRMTHGCTLETRRTLMTSLTCTCSLYVVAGFTFSSRAIMAACTASGDAGVVHSATSKA